MVKRYYQGLVSLYFSTPMTVLAFTVFLIAFANNMSTGRDLRWLIGCAAAVLAVVMFFYYKNKLGIKKALKDVEDIDEYEKAGMLERSFVLEDRMLAGIGLKVSEHSTKNLTSAEAKDKGRKVIIHIEGKDDSFDVQAIDRDEAERFAAYLKKNNPDIELINLTPKGNGTLKELGAEDLAKPEDIQ